LLKPNQPGGDGYTEFTDAPYLFPSGEAMEEIMVDDLRRAAPNAVGCAAG
jgi:hypothetical protein